MKAMNLARVKNEPNIHVDKSVNDDNFGRGIKIHTSEVKPILRG